MKLKITLLLLYVLGTSWICSQGTLFYDQQSTNAIEGTAFLQTDQPMGQSFTPSLSTVSFVDLILYDGDIFQNSGATVYVNLRSNSITGTILASTLPVFLPDSFFGVTNFVFSAPVTVTPGAEYYFQPVQSGSAEFGSIVTDGSYTGGSLFRFGNPVAGRNLWFREGTIVPEPSATAVGFLGMGAALIGLYRRRGC